MENEKEITLQELEDDYSKIAVALYNASKKVKCRISQLSKEMPLSRAWEEMVDAYESLKRMVNEVDEFGDCVVKSYRLYEETNKLIKED